jgi:hypothetical protein
VEEVPVNWFREIAWGISGGVVLIAATIVYSNYANPPEPIVCMQDAPVTYDWNNNLIVEGMNE